VAKNPQGRVKYLIPFIHVILGGAFGKNPDVVAPDNNPSSQPRDEILYSKSSFFPQLSAKTVRDMANRPPKGLSGP
jgi:hypothetical protein